MAFTTDGSTITAAAAIIQALDAQRFGVKVEGTLNLMSREGTPLGCQIYCEGGRWGFEAESNCA